MYVKPGAPQPIHSINHGLNGHIAQPPPGAAPHHGRSSDRGLCVQFVEISSDRGLCVEGSSDGGYVWKDHQTVGYVWPTGPTTSPSDRTGLEFVRSFGVNRLCGPRLPLRAAFASGQPPLSPPPLTFLPAPSAVLFRLPRLASVRLIPVINAHHLYRIIPPHHLKPRRTSSLARASILVRWSRRFRDVRIWNARHQARQPSEYMNFVYTLWIAAMMSDHKQDRSKQNTSRRHP